MLDVIIVSPKYATETFTPNPQMDLGEEVMHKPTGIACPHLELSNDKYLCKVHHFEWFKDTPCFQYGQIEESEASLCRTGNYVVNTNEMMRSKLAEIYNKKENNEQE